MLSSFVLGEADGAGLQLMWICTVLSFNCKLLQLRKPDTALQQMLHGIPDTAGL